MKEFHTTPSKKKYNINNLPSEDLRLHEEEIKSAIEYSGHTIPDIVSSPMMVPLPSTGTMPSTKASEGTIDLDGTDDSTHGTDFMFDGAR